VTAEKDVGRNNTLQAWQGKLKAIGPNNQLLSNLKTHAASWDGLVNRGKWDAPGRLS